MRSLALVALLGAALLSGGCPMRLGFPPLPLAADGTYVHEGSGLTFPATAGAFTRGVPHPYDEFGRDVGVGYDLAAEGAAASGPSAVTIYVFPVPLTPKGAPMSHAEVFDGEADALAEGKVGLEEVQRETRSVPFRGGAVTVSAVEYVFDGPSRRPGRSSTFLVGFVTDGWRVTYRATFPATERDASFAAVLSLLDALGLPAVPLR